LQGRKTALLVRAPQGERDGIFVLRLVVQRRERAVF
jgi:hypothetical protein